MTPRYGYSATCGRGTPAKATEQPTVVLPGPNTITADLVGPTPESASHLQIMFAICHGHQVVCIQLVRETMGRCSKPHTWSELANVSCKTVHEKIIEKMREDPSLTDASVRPQSRQGCAKLCLGLSAAEKVAHEVPQNTNLVETN